MTSTRNLATDNDIDPEVIFGVDTPILECDALAMQCVRKDWQGYERGLFTSKWFDYRFMHPVHATYLYAHEWQIAHRQAFGRTFDRKAAEHIKLLKHEDIFACDKAFLAGLWRGRQHADALCMPYDLYLQLALEAALKYWKQKYMPRPMHLYSANICESVVQRWEELQSAKLYVGAHVELRSYNYQGTDAQNAHHEWLLAQAMKRSNPVPCLTQFYEDDLLPVEKIRVRFGDKMIEKITQ